MAGVTSAAWEFWIDVGGTFTDCIGRAPDGAVRTCKVLSSAPGEQPAPVTGIRRLMGLGADEAVGPVRVRLGTTRGTNALLERKGARVALVTTKGFGDLPRIGTQARPELFALHVVKPEPLAERVVELDERIDAAGQVLKPLGVERAVAALRPLVAEGIEALAVCLLNSYVNPAHEDVVAEAAARCGFAHVSVSSRVSRTIKLLDRGDTTVVDAYLSPVIRRYVAAVRRALPAADLKLMTSAGGLADAAVFVGKDSLFSGPAGGVVGFAHAARAAGFEKAIGFDMGGTSTDVSRFDGRHEVQFATEKAGVRIVAPMYAIETVAAGGGSVCWWDGQKLRVGPDSAGADPGPVCYGRGGPLSVTDVNLWNGKIDGSRFPFALDRPAVAEKLAGLSARIEADGGGRMAPEEIADGFTRVANEKMAAAVRTISAARGYDPGEHVLVAFGGAAAQHACAVARRLGMRRILLHPLAGVLSAYGLGMADVRRFAERSVLKPLGPATLAGIEPTFRRIERRLRGEVVAQGVAPEHVLPPVRMLDLRYVGEEAALTVRPDVEGDYAAPFERAHRQLYGHVHEGRAVEIATLRVEAIGRTPKPAAPRAACRPRRVQAAAHADLRFDGRAHRAAVFQREELSPGDGFEGPALVAEAFSTIVVDPGWRAEVTGLGDLLLTDARRPGRAAAESAERDPVRLELYGNRFRHVAKQMGVTLQRTSLSVNVKERLDFSCAILDAAGELVVNAPHIPVHLGAMGESVKALLRAGVALRAGDAFVSNDPNLGGSHLPDLTVMTPVFGPGGEGLLFFTASRAHHAEIGGVRPGSTYPFATCLAEEGVVLRNLRIAAGGRFLGEALRAALASGAYPSRSPEENVADVRAAVAANHVGARALSAMVAERGLPAVTAYLGHLRDAAREKAAAALRRVGDGEYRFADALDDGAPVCVSLRIRDGRMRADFTGSAPVRSDSLNANRAVVQSALLYCLRCLVDEDVPLNAGALDVLDLVLPEGMLNPPAHADPRRCPAVVGGNVEVSQRIVDVVLGALGVAAASQGTMNNVVIGSERFGYYETVCGGCGAGPGFAGADAVHSHMTNTRITDVEVLEQRYPLRVRAFSLRRGSGGAGRHAGGCGVVRRIELLAPLSVCLLTQRRLRAPFGLAGGGPGLPGRNLLRRAGRREDETLGPLAQLDGRAGDVLTILTPGGGGYGMQ